MTSLNDRERSSAPADLLRHLQILLPALVWISSLVLYLTTLTQVHTFDALSYVLDVDRKPWQELFHPHHLAYGLLGALVSRLAQASGYTDGALIPLQVVNALAGSLGVTLFFALVKTITRRADLSLGGALLLGGSYAYWYYAVEVEVYTIAALLLIVCLTLLLRLLEYPTVGGFALLGLVQGLAVLFHQTNGLLSVPVIALLVFVRDSAGADRKALAPSAWRRRIEMGTAYALVLGLIVVGSYVLVGGVISGFRSWAEFLEWITGYARTGWWGGSITGDKWADLGAGLADTLAQPGGAWFGVGLVAMFVWHIFSLVRVYGRPALVLLSWLGAYGAFFLWWEPDNIEFWIASLPPALLLLMLALVARPTIWRPGVWAVLAIGAAMLTINYAAIMRRGDADTDLQRRIAEALAQESMPDDLLIVPDGLQELYLPYYEERANVFSLNQALFDSSGDWEAACTLVRQRIDSALEHGAAVLIGADVLQPTPTTLDASAGAWGRVGLLERFGLEQSQVTACFAAYASGLERVDLPAELPTYYRLPSAQQLAERGGWDFTRGHWGWRVGNAETASSLSDAPGWTLTPGVDPWLMSPPATIDPQRYRSIEIRMAATTAVRDAQLFFLDEQAQASEERSLRWELEPGMEMRSYCLDLTEQLGWSGMVTGLRLDPVGTGDGGWTRLERIRLVAEPSDCPATP